MSIVTGFRVLAKKGKKFAPRAKKASGFDYPTKEVGKSNWKGTDGKPVTVYYDPATGAKGLAAAQYVLSKLDEVMRSCDAWFGVQGQSGNVIVAPDFGGAYHYGCSFDQGGDWYLSLSDKDTTVGLAVAEIVESYMGLQAKGWDCGGSGGEGLSRFLAEVATGGATGAMADYSAGPSWDGQNWIDRDSGTDQDYPSTGCAVLYCWWLMKLGYSVEKLVGAGESGGVLAGNYRSNTGKLSAWADFKAAVEAVGGPGGFDSDNPFDATNPPYPAGGSPPPPPPPPPGGGGIIWQQSGTLTLGDVTVPAQVTMELVSQAPVPTEVNWWKLIFDVARLTAAIASGEPAQIAAAAVAVLSDLGIALTPANQQRIVDTVKASPPHTEHGES